MNEHIHIVVQKYVFRDDNFGNKVLSVYAKLVGGPLPLSHYSYLMWITMENKKINGIQCPRSDCPWQWPWPWTNEAKV